MSTSDSEAEGLRVLVVDDEELACQNLCRKLLALGGLARVDGTIDPVDAVERLRGGAYDLVFLDVRMPGLGGFDVLAQFPERERPFAAVFCTAYDEHALRAFEAAALDYLVKPVDPVRLAATVARVRRSQPTELARARANGAAGWLERLVVRLRGTARVVAVDDVVAFASEAHHAVAYTGDDEHVLECSLGALESQLDPARFVRTHRAHLVQLARVVAVVGHEVELAGGRRIPLSRRHRTAFLEALARRAR